MFSGPPSPISNTYQTQITNLLLSPQPHFPSSYTNSPPPPSSPLLPSDTTPHASRVLNPAPLSLFLPSAPKPHSHRAPQISLHTSKTSPSSSARMSTNLPPFPESKNLHEIDQVLRIIGGSLASASPPFSPRSEIGFKEGKERLTFQIFEKWLFIVRYLNSNIWTRHYSTSSFSFPKTSTELVRERVVRKFVGTTCPHKKTCRSAPYPILHSWVSLNRWLSEIVVGSDALEQRREMFIILSILLWPSERSKSNLRTHPWLWLPKHCSLSCSPHLILPAPSPLQLHKSRSVVRAQHDWYGYLSKFHPISQSFAHAQLLLFLTQYHLTPHSFGKPHSLVLFHIVGNRVSQQPRSLRARLLGLYRSQFPANCSGFSALYKEK